MESIVKKLNEKSIEAFIMGIEIYNKPTIKYRIEGFSFFICNAWELMLKAHIINTKGENQIYYQDKPSRTISLEKCLALIFTNKKDPLRLNIEKIIELRNTSTHFITEEYETIFAPLFQACVMNYIDKLDLFHNIDITRYIPQNFLTLHINLNEFSEENITAKYPKELSKKFLETRNKIDNLSENNNNYKFSINISQNIVIVKNEKKADVKVSLSKNQEESAFIFKQLKDVNNTYKYKANKCIEEINKKVSIKINMYNFTQFISFYNIKEQAEYCYKYNPGNTIKQNQYSYSYKLIQLIITEINNNPNLFNDIKKLKK